MDTTTPPVWPEEGVDMSVVESKKLLCPFCVTHTAYMVKPHTPTTVGYFVHCMACNADGPLADSEAEAQARWGRATGLVADNTWLLDLVIKLSLILRDVPGRGIVEKVKWLMQPDTEPNLDPQ
jgi:hypothetical protein